MAGLRKLLVPIGLALLAASVTTLGQDVSRAQPVYACCPGTTVLESVTASPSNVVAGGTVVVSVHLTDVGTPVTSASICYLLPTGGDAPGCTLAPQAGMKSIPPLTLASGSAQDGVWQASIAIPPLAASGTWTVFDVATTDGTGGNVFMAPDPAFDGGAFTVTGTDDLTPPTIASVSGPTSPVPIGQTFTISAHVTDASGVAAVSMEVTLFTSPFPTGSLERASLVSGSAQDGIWQISLVASSPGDVLFVLAQDLAGNGGGLQGTPLLSFDVTTADVTAPVITIISPTQSTYLLNQTVLANYSCTDPDSAVTTCSGPAVSGSAIDTLSIGAKTFTVTASDPTGNTSSRSVAYTVTYNVCVLFDQTERAKSGSTVPIKLELCNAARTDVSSSTVTVTVSGLVNLTTNAAATPQASGNANPGNIFRLDPTLGTNGGYIYNLSTVGLQPGLYEVSFTVSSDPVTHTVRFNVD